MRALVFFASCAAVCLLVGCSSDSPHAGPTSAGGASGAGGSDSGGSSSGGSSSGGSSGGSSSGGSSSGGSGGSNSGGSGSGGSLGSTGGSGGSSGGPASATFTQVKVIFQASCGTGTCHLNGQSEGKLKLDGKLAYAQLVGVPAAIAPSLVRVVPNDPAASFLVTKLLGKVPTDGSQGSPMPLITGQLQSDQIALIKAWIASGAKDD